MRERDKNNGAIFSRYAISTRHVSETDDSGKKEEFSIRLATFLLEYKNQDDRQRKTETFVEGDWVEITKESSKKGWRARVLDPNWNGLVKVQCVKNDGWVRVYESHHLRKVPSGEMSGLGYVLF